MNRGPWYRQLLAEYLTQNGQILLPMGELIEGSRMGIDELIIRRHCATNAEVRSALFENIDGFYGTLRRHASLGYLSLLNYERNFKKAA